MSNFSRVSTANMFDNALRNLSQRQSGLSNLQENLTSGKRVVRASDDPVAAAQAERALTRMSRNDTDVRALNSQRNTMTLAESTLGQTGDAMQEFRALVVNAGNGTYTQTERDAIAQQLVSLRDQIMTYSNRKDSNGIPLFQGLGSAEQPFTGPNPLFGFAGLPGQVASNGNSIANVLDGMAAWMNVPTGNGVFTVDVNAANQGRAWANVGQVTDPSAFAASTVDEYVISFGGTAAAPTYDVLDRATMTSVLGGGPQPFPVTNTATSTPVTIAFDGISIGISGKPAPGDEFSVRRNSADPDTQSNVFQVLDNVIGAIRNGSNPDGSTASGTLTHAITRGLAEIDAAMNRLNGSRGFAGDLLNRADRIEGDLDKRAVQLEEDRSRAEDLDMIQGISDFQNQQVGYEAALKSYAMVQKLSLFNFVG